MVDFPEFSSTRIFPAIDVRGGRCVRLIRGARDAELDYNADPVEVAERWETAGAECLHVIDLGAAFGEEASTDIVLSVASVSRVSNSWRQCSSQRSMRFWVVIGGSLPVAGDILRLWAPRKASRRSSGPAACFRTEWTWLSISAFST